MNRYLESLLLNRFLIIANNDFITMSFCLDVEIKLIMTNNLENNQDDTKLPENFILKPF